MSSLVYLNAKYIYLVSNITQWVISEWGNSKKDYLQREKFSWVIMVHESQSSGGRGW